MNYIINPIWFYLISVLDTINIVSWIVCVVTVSVTSMAYMSLLESEDYADVEEECARIRLKKIIRRGITTVIITTSIGIITPSESAMKEMMIASCVTEENITEATNYGKDLVDYIFEKIDGKEKDDEQ